MWGTNWNFKLNEITCPNVHIFQGRKDVGTTVEVIRIFLEFSSLRIQMAEYIHKNINGSKLQVYDDKGHLAFFEIWNDILKYIGDCHVE